LNISIIHFFFLKDLRAVLGSEEQEGEEISHIQTAPTHA